jgi:thiamine thiazole synthase
MNEKPIFHPVGEKEITRAIVSEFSTQFSEYVESDCMIIGGGPSGLMLGKIIAEKGVKTILVERNNYLGGGFWMGGYLMNKITVRHPSQAIFEDLGIPFKETGRGLFVADGPHACSKLIASACDAGVMIANMTSFDDLVLRENNRVAGAVINWTPIRSLPREIACVDPIALESKIVVDASGHDAVVVKSLEERDLYRTAGQGAMWVEHSEELVVEHTKEIHPGLIVVGMSVSTTFGLPRMGPTFGSMLLSGQKGAEIVLSRLEKF